MLTRRSLFIGALAITIASAAAIQVATDVKARSAAPLVYTGIIKGTAVGGYDPVAYFKDGKPSKGKTAHTFTHEGATWRFATAENLATFKAEPAKYAPAYGGHCAWAMAQGYTAKGDPNHWKVVDGRLYLNYDARIQSRWEKDIQGFITKADGQWPKLTGKTS